MFSEGTKCPLNIFSSWYEGWEHKETKPPALIQVYEKVLQMQQYCNLGDEGEADVLNF